LAQILGFAEIEEGPTIESVTLLGYDARDVALIKNHAGIDITSTGSGTRTDNKLTEDAPIAFYLKNTGSNTLVLNTIKFAGDL
jgi:hypothetical protein